MVIFTIVWLCTFGKHHFWLLPNLTEDVGFFESFWPLYKHDLKNSDSKDKDSKDRDHKKKKRKCSDDSNVPLVDNDDKTQDNNKESGSESASTVESVPKSNASNESKDVTNGLNGFEILDTNELNDDHNDAEGRTD